MIIGTGVDLERVDRIRAAIERHGKRFLERVFTPGEIAYVEARARRAESYAARFAAKEAAMKALGTGWDHGVRWVDVEIARQDGGRPTLRLHGKAAEIAAGLGCRATHVSLSHTSEDAIAQVILEG
jgi:holo-[acyl-carrier protein] synthase